jgi:hypothetical protein
MRSWLKRHVAWPGRAASLRLAAVLVAVGYAVPIATEAYDRLVRVNQAARERLIHEHRLWETQAGFRGRPEVWARIASRLLNDRQLLMRVAAKYAGQSEQIELEYRRDLTIARAEVVLSAVALWAGPLAALGAGAWLLLRRRKPPPPPMKAQPSSVSDARYLPPDEH